MLNARATLWSSSHSHSYTHNPVVMSPIRNNGLSIDAMSPTGGTQSGKSLESRPDVEYGVTITKVRRRLLGPSVLTHLFCLGYGNE